MEWLRGWLFTGFPWLQLGYSQSDVPLAALATVGGIHLVTFAVAVTAGAVVVVFFQGGAGRIAAIALAGALWLGGWLLDGREWTRPTGEPVDIALLQGAIPQDEKWLVRESRGDAREIPRPQPPGARREDHRLAGIGGARSSRTRPCPSSRPSAASRRRADPT